MAIAHLAKMDYPKLGKRYFMKDDKVCETYTIVVSSFCMDEYSDDPYVTAAEPIYKWQQTEAGKFIMEHALDQPEFFCIREPHTMQTRIRITATLEGKDLTFYKLKFPEALV
jgi:hypothetical protein